LKQRRFDIDWLRTVTMLIIFFFHNARFFDNLDWHLKNSDKSFGFTVFVGFLAQWIMPMFFLLSGAGSWFALEFKNSKHYLLERVKRLLVPFYLIGFLILIPPQYYWEQVTHGRFLGDFFQFIPHYFHFPFEPQFFGIYFGFNPNFMSYWPGHLWFLRYLFILSLLTLPIMKYFKSESGRKLITKLAGLCDHRGGIFLLVVPIAVVQIALRAAFPNYLSWADFAYWLICFLIGYVLPADDRFTQAIKRNSWISLIMGVVAFMLMAYLLSKPGYFNTLLIHPSYTVGYLGYQVLCSLNTWCWIVFVFSIGTKFLNFNNKILSYCNEAVLPFYILHQTIILTIGFFIIQWNLNIMLKYLIISTSSFALIMVIYELLIRRFNITRFLFGMKAQEQLQGLSGVRS
jgi:glucan biosynthesis protein C